MEQNSEPTVTEPQQPAEQQQQQEHQEPQEQAATENAAPQNETPAQGTNPPANTPEAAPATQEQQPQQNDQSSQTYYSPVEAIWVESPLPEFMYFLNSNGTVIEPQLNSFYPPVGPIVYDRNGHPFKAVYPAPKTAAQKMVIDKETLQREHLNPIAEKFHELFSKKKEEPK